MSTANTQRSLDFFRTPEHPCSYLSGRAATTLFADPQSPKDTRLYTILSRNGFRRSGEHVYRPQCKTCSACIATRVPVAEFLPRRSQRRVWRRNRDIYVVACEARITDEQFELYSRYINSRHWGGGMQNPTREQYVEFLTSSWSQTVFYEFRHNGRLLAVAVTDNLLDGCSAVYTFFEPQSPERSLGVYTILWQIQELRRRKQAWLYLGYLIHEAPKMRYKRDYQPQEHFIDGAWLRA